MRRYVSISAILLSLALTPFLGGCSMLAHRNEVPKAFVGRTIVYNVQSGEAMTIMRNAERALAQHNNLEQVPEEERIKLYRDADLNGDQFISKKEAEAYWNGFLPDYLDKLGPLRITFPQQEVRSEKAREQQGEVRLETREVRQER